MAKKKNYSTGSDSKPENPFAALSKLNLGDLPPGPDKLPSDNDNSDGADAGANQNDSLRVLIDRKQRRGKSATIVTGFTGSDDALAELGKTLKVKCGVGGSVKDGEIIIQGDKRDRVVELLREMGYRDVKKSGG